MEKRLAGISSHFNLSVDANPAQVRLDEWNRFREATERLEAKCRRGIDASELRESVKEALEELETFEKYWVYPGMERVARMRGHLERGDYDLLSRDARLIAHLVSELGDRASRSPEAERDGNGGEVSIPGPDLHYFTVLLVDELAPAEMEDIKRIVDKLQEDAGGFVYSLLLVDNMEDALIAALVNYDVQACVIRQDFPLRSKDPVNSLSDLLDDYESSELVEEDVPDRGPVLAEWMKELRPHINLYLVTDESLMEAAKPTFRLFDRVFYNLDNTPELHMTLLAGIKERYRTPFFDALKKYASEPVGNFHALPVARGNSILNSKWILDMAEFYGLNIFLAETSSTTGGLDSLLAPEGVIREAQEKAAKTWGAQKTYFATNGTSSSNKIVVQALTRPGEIVLIDRNCHKSHHYGLLLSGAHPIYLEAYPLEEYAMYGAVPLRTIKKHLLELKELGRLEKVKMLLLTNCTFDGITYNPRMVMEEVLAIKPDMCFLWDEAWYSFATFNPLSRQRTAMYSAERLADRLSSEEYREEYDEYLRGMEGLDPDDEGTWLDNRLLPDPDQVRLRVYATQSTHKSMSSLRQGSMIHVYDQQFAGKAEEQLVEALLTHTTTSPNYQIVASLDLARRQADLEGYAMVNNVYQMAVKMRERVREDPLLSKYFRILEPAELIPGTYRQSGIESYVADVDSRVEETILETWERDEFALDPTRITLYLADTGYSGNEFKVEVLMDRYGIQVNKTSINSVLFIITIGVTWSSMSYLLDVLREIADGLERDRKAESKAESIVLERKIESLTGDLPPLPGFSRFHARFRPDPRSPEGDMRSAFYLAYEEDNREYVRLDEAIEHISEGRELVSTRFVVPYPPGFPVLTPGQVVSEAIVEFMRKLDVKEIHGYRPELGLSVFTEKALARQGDG